MESLSPSRRQLLAVAAATVTLPMLDSALGAMRSARATATLNPAARTAGGGAGGGAVPAPGAAEKPGWFTTTLKPADVKDSQFTVVAGHAIVLARSGTTLAAISNKCTHKGCTISPKAGAKILACGCHGAQFNLDGTVAKAPATLPLTHYAIRVNAAGLIEIDPGQSLTKDDKNATVTVPAA